MKPTLSYDNFHNNNNLAHTINIDPLNRRP